MMFSSPLFMALATIGVAYQLWAQQGQVTGTVVIASLNMAWDDPCICPAPRTVCKINPANPQIIDVGAQKAYPRYRSVCSLASTNLGSIPVSLTGRKVAPPSITTATEEDPSDEEVRLSSKDDLPTVVTPSRQLVNELEIIIADNVQQNTTYQISLSVDFQQHP